MNCIYCKKVIEDTSPYCNWCGRKQEKKNTIKRANGDGCVYKMPGGKWKAEVTLGYDEAGKRKRKTKITPTRKAALEALPLLRGVYNSVTLGFAYDKWSSKRYDRISGGKVKAYARAFSHFELLSNRQILDISLAQLQSIVDKMPGEYYPKRDAKVVLTGIYDWAVRNEYVGRNLGELIILPPLGKKSKVIFSEKEISLLWESKDPFAKHILILIYTGMRIGEYLSLTDIHEDYVITGSKTETGRDRVIPLAKKIQPLFKDLQIPTDYVFRKEFDRLKKELRLNPQITPHSCRHTADTLFVRAGVPPEKIKEILGHADYSTTVDIYTHLNKTDVLNSLDIL